MSSEESFMEAILQSPDDDALRLIFADWLEERGDSRGEFIRVQYALLDEKLDERKRFELMVREQRLIHEHGHQWAGPIHGAVHSYRFKRGMVEFVELDGESFIRQARRLFAASPIRSARIRCNPRLEHSAALFKCPHLSRLVELDLSWCGFGDVEVHRLTESSHLMMVRTLRLAANQIGLEGARALAGTTAFPALEQLFLGGNAIGDLGLQSLCASPNLARLKVLGVSDCEVEIHGLQGVARDCRLGSLEELYLDGNRLDRRALAILADLPIAGRLRALHLKGTGLTSTDVQPLTISPVFAGLESLDLRNNLLTGVRSLVISPYLTGLQHLYLEGNNISPAACQKLKARFGAAVTF